jgi:AraC-like DNA-binding protein
VGVEGDPVIAELNRLVELVEDRLADDLAAPALASELGTTEYHLRRTCSSLTEMPISECIRRRRMSVAKTDVLGGDDLLSIAVRHGYGSTEAFGKAFRSVHGVSVGEVKRNGGVERAPADQEATAAPERPRAAVTTPQVGSPRQVSARPRRRGQ